MLRRAAAGHGGGRKVAKVERNDSNLAGNRLAVGVDARCGARQAHVLAQVFDDGGVVVAERVAQWSGPRRAAGNV